MSNEQLTENCWRVTLEAPQIASEIKPGQFINVKIPETNDPLFRRPFSVFRRVREDRGYSGIEVVYEVVGRGTRLMTNLKPGDELDVIGPLGHGFEWYRDKKVPEPATLVPLRGPVARISRFSGSDHSTPGGTSS